MPHLGVKYVIRVHLNEFPAVVFFVRIMKARIILPWRELSVFAGASIRYYTWLDSNSPVRGGFTCRKEKSSARYRATNEKSLNYTPMRFEYPAFFTDEDH